MPENVKRLLWSQNHCLVAAGCLASNEAHRICFFGPGNQPVTLPVLKDQTHHSSDLVERGICEILFLLQSLQPLLDFERLKTQCCPFSPPVEAAVLENPLISGNRSVGFWIGGFGLLAQFVSHKVLGEVSKRHASFEIWSVEL